MRPSIFIILFCALMIPLLLGHLLPIWKEYKRTTKDVINHDPHMRKFVYKVPLSRDNILSALQTAGSTYELSYTFDPQRSVISFAEYGAKKNYSLRVLAFSDHSILQLEETALLGMSSQIPLKLNPFFISKLSAEPLPFSQYEF